MAERPSTRPGKFLVTFAIVMCGVALFTVLDARQRENLERVTTDPALANTAFADEDLFPSPETVKLHAEVARRDGRPLYRMRMTISDRHDEHLERVSRDDSDRYWIYRDTKREGSSLEPEPNRFFLKVGQRAFLQITDIAPPGA